MSYRSLRLCGDLLSIRSQPLRSQIRNFNPLNRYYSADASPPPPAQPPAVEVGGGAKPSPLRSSLNADEVAKFAALAETWWDSEGPFKQLHLINPVRLSFIRSTLCRHFRKDPYCARPFEGLKFIDIGCGGGILSEPLARMGARVTGIDAVEKNIKIARLHAGSDPLTSCIDYSCTTAGCTILPEVHVMHQYVATCLRRPSFLH